MFHSSAHRVRAWLTRLDDVLDDVLGDEPVDAPPHPHRIPLRWDRQRRAGAVAPRPAHCISPVRAGSVTAAEPTREAAAR